MVRGDGRHESWGHRLKRELMESSWLLRGSRSPSVWFTHTPYDWEWVSKNKGLVIATIISIILIPIFPLAGIPLTIYFVIKAEKSYDSFIREKLGKAQGRDGGSD